MGHLNSIHKVAILCHNDCFYIAHHVLFLHFQVWPLTLPTFWHGCWYFYYWFGICRERMPLVWTFRFWLIESFEYPLLCNWILAIRGFALPNSVQGRLIVCRDTVLSSSASKCSENHVVRGFCSFVSTVWLPNSWEANAPHYCGTYGGMNFNVKLLPSISLSYSRPVMRTFLLHFIGNSYLVIAFCVPSSPYSVLS